MIIKIFCICSVLLTATSSKKNEDIPSSTSKNSDEKEPEAETEQQSDDQ